MGRGPAPCAARRWGQGRTTGRKGRSRGRDGAAAGGGMGAGRSCKSPSKAGLFARSRVDGREASVGGAERASGGEQRACREGAQAGRARQS